MKKLILIILFILGFKFTYAQIEKYYFSKDSKYFPTILCLTDTALSKFCIVEKMGYNHQDNIYYERGTYSINGDSIFFYINEVGFEPADLKEESYIKKGLLKSNAIFLLNFKGNYYLKLKRKKCFSHKFLCDECICRYK